MKKIFSKLENEFDSRLWQRGKEYYMEGLVDNIIKSGSIITAQSHGNKTYYLEIDIKTKKMGCTCPCDFACKHLASLAIWLQNNSVKDLNDLDEELSKLSKKELINQIKKMIKINPDFSFLTQKLSDKALNELIKKLWIYDQGFHQKYQYIKENVLEKSFELKLHFLSKLIDCNDHDPEGMGEYVEEYLRALMKQKPNRKQKEIIEKKIKGYWFDYE